MSVAADARAGFDAAIAAAEADICGAHYDAVCPPPQQIECEPQPDYVGAACVDGQCTLTFVPPS